MYFIVTIFLAPYAYSDQPVIDPTAILSLAKIIIDTERQIEEIQQLTAEIKNWQKLDWTQYRTDITQLLGVMQNIQTLSTDLNRDVSDFQTLFPGYKSTLDDYNNSFSNRNSALINLLKSQLRTADQAYRLNSNGANTQLFSAAAIAQEELSSLRQLNVLVASESRTEAAYRANHIQESADKKHAVENFVGTHQKQTNYETTVGGDSQ